MTSKNTIKLEDHSKGPLYDLLHKGFPQFHHPKTQALRIIPLTKVLNCTTQNVYRWLTLNEIPAKRIDIIVEASENRITKIDLVPFLVTS